MAYLTHSTTAGTYQDYPINNGRHGTLATYPDLLKKILGVMTHMTTSHNKVLFVRMDLHYPHSTEAQQGTIGNEALSKFLKLFKEHYTYNKIEMHYIWVREQSPYSLPHYHCVFLLNGNKIQNTYGLMERANLLWHKIVGGSGGLVHYCHSHTPNGIMIRRPSSTATGDTLAGQQVRYQETFSRCFEWASYLAKANQKQHTPSGVRRFGVSMF
ncbi:YagK/YfjJ domain-containing protein [Desulfobotulus mexicanus]|nr:inovirus-type Gp2 protein [Desulfobotulus mexicanus]